MQIIKIFSTLIIISCTIYIFYIISNQDKKPEENIIFLTKAVETQHQPVVVTPQKSIKIKNGTKNILYYYPMFDHADFYMGKGEELFSKCPIYKNCYIHYNKKYLPIEEWDALLFHMPEAQHWTNPAKRSEKQRYVFYSLESPIHTHNRLEKFNNFFNWTMTYRLDSDVYRPYGVVSKQKTEYKLPNVEEISQRPKKIAWFVSNCYVNSKRNDLAAAINKSIPVDVYGRCGKLKCNEEIACRKMLEQTYKFYLSFENSICLDYLTEKTFKILEYNVIPIVYSGANLSQVLPPKSVINVQDFENVQKLVEYIQFLDENPEEYLKYFEWKKDYVVDNRAQLGLCDLCKRLNEDRTVKIYSDLDRWWNGPNKSYCSNSFIEKFLT